MQPEKQQVIIVHETIWQSIVRDVLTFGAMIGTVYMGVLLQSDALQWVAAILSIIWVLSNARSKASQGKMSIAEARVFLDKLEGKADERR